MSLLLALPLLLACDAPVARTATAQPAVVPPAPALRRLTRAQYDHVVRDLLGDDIVLPAALEPDSTEAGLQAVGAGTASLSALGVERYEDAALLLAGQVVDEPARKAAVLPCPGQGPDDLDCAAQIVEELGLRAFRRPPTDEEVERYAALIAAVAAEADSFDEGLRYGLAAMLQSPWFLYRVETGQPDPDQPDLRLLTDWELASRLSFLLWNTAPDAELLAAAAAGELSSDAGLLLQAERLLADPRAADGLDALYADVLALHGLDEVSKDPTVYTHASDDLTEAARQETMLGLQALVLHEDGDLRDLLTTQRTFVDPRLAAQYGVPAADADGMAEVWLDAEQGRRGLLGQAAILMLYAHSTRSSATKRGVFVRTRLLCQVIPSPPAGVDTSIPETDADALTLRDRIASHLEDPTCAACHAYTDPIGLGLENFDGIGRWRDTENEARIDPSGELDGVGFADAWELGDVVAAHPNFLPCQARQLYQVATGHAVTEGEEEAVAWLGTAFDAADGSLRSLLLGFVQSPAFRTVGALD